MARQGTARNKLVSSGRLAGGGRGYAFKKKVTGRRIAPLEVAYSLYSTDSEDQVATMHKGLDRCAPLLNDLLQAEIPASPAESKPKLQTPKSVPVKTKSKVTLAKVEAQRKRIGKKSNSTTQLAKRPAPVQKTVLSSQSLPGLRRQTCIQREQQQQSPVVHTASRSEVKLTGPTPVAQSQHFQPHVSHLVPRDNLQTTGQTSPTPFNCRLTTSSPALIPQQPPAALSQTQWPAGSGQTLGQPGSFQTVILPAQCSSSISGALSVQQQHQHPLCTAMPTLQQAPLFPATGPSDPPRVVSVGQSVPLPPQTGPLNFVQAAQTLPNRPQAVPQPNSQGQWSSTGELSSENENCCSTEEEEEEEEEEGEEEEGEEEELDRVDTTPVRDTGCQIRVDKHSKTLRKSKAKTASPEKTAVKVMTVRYLLSELRALVANQDTEAMQLISEVEQCVSLLPAMVGSTNVQAELALALQPLRNENVQLRRRLRILNQQLQERERAEKQARAVNCDHELISLQSLNITLQTQLSDSRQELGSLQEENKRLRQSLEDKENELQQSKEKSRLENSLIRMDVTEALAEMRKSHAKLEDCEKERFALSQNLQQKETEITRLQETIRNLQKSPTKDITSHLARTHVSKPPPELTQHVLDLHENQQQKTTVADRVSDSVKTYLQTLQYGGNTPEHQRAHNAEPSSSKAPDANGSTGQNSADRPTRERDQNGMTFVPLKETVGLNENAGLKYLGLAFEKLGITNGLPTRDLKALDDNRGQEFLLHSDGVGAQLKRTNEAAAVSFSDQQAQIALRCFRLGEEPVCTGRLSAFENTLSSCEMKSLVSDFSVNTWSTFNTRDEQDFRNGLAALDASIASLQKTLKAEIKK